MKKLIVLFVFMVLLTSCNKEVFASSEDYDTFKEIKLLDGEFIDSYEENELNDKCPDVEKRKVFGWRTCIINKGAKAVYVSEKLFEFRNDGLNDIEFKYETQKENTVLRELKVTGSLKVKSGAKFKKNKTQSFDFGLESKIENELTYMDEEKKEEKYETKFTLSPGAKATLTVEGEGKITNGYAAKYAFLFRIKKGAFEEFVVTSQNYKLQMSRL